MKKSVLIALLLTVAATGWILSGQFGSGTTTAATRDDVETASELAEDTVVSVRVARLQAQPRQRQIIVTGRTEASRTVEVRAETYGRVAELMVGSGDRVDAGEVIAKVALDDRPAKLAEAEALLRQREIEHKAARELSKKGFRSETNVAAARAQLDAARAIIEQNRVDIERTTFRAPFSAVVDKGNVELGDYVRVGDTVARLVDLDPILIVGHASEREVNDLDVGSLGSAILIGGRAVEGVLSFVSPIADMQTRTFRFELEVANPDNSIRAGITSQIVIDVDRSLAHLISPSILTLKGDGTVGVKVVNENNIVEFLPVTILGDTPDGVWLGGLGEQVDLITVGQDFVVEGQLVEAVFSESPIRVGGNS
ncbi:MAG: efflux RND transporter periplasmic adaptor subunit [Alphaproteobacteria bacterium]